MIISSPMFNQVLSVSKFLLKFSMISPLCKPTRVSKLCLWIQETNPLPIGLQRVLFSLLLIFIKGL